MPLLSTKANTKRNLKEFCSDLFILILQLRESNEYGDALKLKNKVLNLLDKLENNAISVGIDQMQVQSVKFALVAFLDETIASSDWSNKTNWLAEPLQLQLFNCYNAGEEFFSRLEQLRQRERANINVIEIYYLCLALGYKGMYKMESPEKIRLLIDELHYLLNANLGDPNTTLSPNGQPRDEIITAVKEKIPLWIILTTIIGSGIIFYLVILFLISNYAADVSNLIESFII